MMVPKFIDPKVQFMKVHENVEKMSKVNKIYIFTEVYGVDHVSEDDGI